MPLSITNNNLSTKSTSLDISQVTGSLQGQVTGLLSNTQITPNVIENVNISNTANIDDSKLSLISSPGKVANSATSATSTNTNNSIVLRDTSGGFSVGNIVTTGATINGNLTSANATINTNITAASATINGNIASTSASINGNLAATNATISNNITATSATITGNVSCTNTTMSGSIIAASATVSGNVTSGGAMINGNITANSTSIGNLTSGGVTINGGTVMNGNTIITGTINTTMISLSPIGITPVLLASGGTSVAILDIVVFYYDNGTDVWESGCFSIAWGRSSASSAFNPSIFNTSKNITLNTSLSEAVGFCFLTLQTTNEFRITFDGPSNATFIRLLNNPGANMINKLVMYVTARVVN